MKVTLSVEGRVTGRTTLIAGPPYAGAAHVDVPGLAECPECGEKFAGETRFKACGKGRRVESHDTYAADAYALCCGMRVGTLRAKVETVFGIEEDERVLVGPWRIY